VISDELSLVNPNWSLINSMMSALVSAMGCPSMFAMVRGEAIPFTSQAI